MSGVSKPKRKKKRGGGTALALILAALAVGLWVYAWLSGALSDNAASPQGGGLSGSGEPQSQGGGEPQDAVQPVVEPTQQTEPQDEEEPQQEPPAEEILPETGLLGETLKNGVKMSERDGVTYLEIQGHEMLLVNKSYHLPESYGDGITAETQAAFDRMAADMASEGLTIWIGSGFRSYETQEAIFGRYAASNGEEAANRYSARPGQSEHQTGLALDIAGGDGSTFLSSSFENTAEFAWLDAHAADYGFALRFLKDREWATGYIYEPWHYRYVGVELAHILKDSGLSVEEYAGLA